MIPSKGDGACLFHSLLQLIESSKEYSQVDLRRDIVLIMAEYPEFFMDQIYDNIAGELCHNYMSEEEYQRSKKVKTLKQWQTDAHHPSAIHQRAIEHHLSYALSFTNM